MFLFRVSAAAVATLLMTAAAKAPDQQRCDAVAPRLAGEAGPPGPRRLDRLPPAEHVLTVFRTIDGCLAPVIVRSDIGGRPAPAPRQ